MEMKEKIKRFKVCRVGIACINYIMYKMGISKFWKENTSRTIGMFLSEEERKNKRFVNSVMRDMIFTSIIRQMTPDEFFLFGFMNLNSKGRKKYIGKGEKSVINHKINDKNDWNIFADKWLTYKRFEDYYKREVIRVEFEDDWSLFNEFTNKHSAFIVKAVNKSCGESIFIVDLNTEKRSKKDIFQNILSVGTCVIEELIIQTHEMAKFHANSVNTIRMATYINENEVHLVFAGFRMGVHGNIVDNAGAGGLIAGIDIDSGIIITPGFRRNGEVCIHHPDSGQQIVGAHIPMWEDLKSFVTDLARRVPTQKFIGWDLALTDDGWIMVEGNPNTSFTGPQIWEKKGLREKFKQLEIV